MDKYKAVVYISGAAPQNFYGSDIDRLRVRATKALTYFEPGLGSTWPQRIEIMSFVRTCSGNSAEWALALTIPYKDIPQDQHEYAKRRKGRLEALARKQQAELAALYGGRPCE